MNLLKLMVVIASMGAMGTARAVTADQTFSAGALPPTEEVRTATYSASSISMPYSFMDISNFTVAAANRTAIASAVGYAPEGTTPIRAAETNAEQAIQRWAGCPI